MTPFPPPTGAPTGGARRAFVLANGPGLLLLVLSAYGAGDLLAAPVLGPVTVGVLLLAGQALVLLGTVLHHERRCTAFDAAAPDAAALDAATPDGADGAGRAGAVAG
ncbi:hypothetical protein [Kitasatospora sp. NPDC004272]